MLLPASPVGKKLLMAATGQLLVLFVVVHVLGNSTIYSGKLNAYAAALHAFPLFLWSVRVVLFLLFAFHITTGIIVTIENKSAMPQAYAVRNDRSATFAGRNMIWTGTIVALFLVYHLLQFTFQVTNPGLAAANHPDAAGRPDVFLMVVRSFHRIGIVAVYLVGLAALWLHLSHAIQSSFQTWGLNGERSFPWIRIGGTVAAIVLGLAYAAIPITIIAGLLR